ncbi:MAG: hypothetical protein KJ947_22540 [Alphaproteobacteria bacterium]|nr:hypothetical protein [Alphaproteobacteria bacterium]MBU1552325.1 hypothetical protein [Alphaproteobacteria bacterium]MBU2334518.1 hypothetical protein [Alphaproteobacteria bacterium]MBU2386373.1 hypothetical protein [Alphaproteobacteria bacterium]
MRSKITTSGQEETPQVFPETPPRAGDMPAYTNQVLFEMNNTLGKIEAKLDGLVKAVDANSSKSDALDGRLVKLENKASFLTGILICAVFLIPICSTIVWWSLGERIEAALRIDPAAK